MSIPPFKPPFLMRGTLTQTYLASLKLRKRGSNPMAEAGEPMEIACSDGVRLLGSYSKHPQSKGLMILLHGWEGSQDSTYVMCTGRTVYNAGYSVFRLNFRDHGDSHHLNEGLFHGPQFQEVMDAVRFAATLEDAPVYVTGYSLGGNFGLRVARAAKEKPIENLKHVFAISPVVNPSLAAPQGDKHPLIKRYFIKKWGRSLIKKQAAFPELYDFKDILARRTIMDMSAALVTQYLPRYKDLTEFFNGYRIWPDDLKDAKTPLTIIMSRDDPVVPAEHLDEINLSETGTMIMLGRGGHNGFFDSVYGQTWYERYILDIMGTP